MKKYLFRFLLLFVLTATFSVTKAAYFRFMPYTIQQPDGEVINCFVSGDEYFNWLHDAAGYTIIQAPDGYYYYGIENNGLVIPSSYKVNTVNPSDAGLDKWAKISTQNYLKKKAFMNSPAAKSAKGPQTGTLNNIVIYIRFSDDTEFTVTRASYDNKFNAPGSVSLYNYFKEVSYNQLSIVSTHYPVCALTTNLSFQDTYPRSYYQPYNATSNPNGYADDNERELREHTLLVNAVNGVSSEIPTSLSIDADNDGQVDNVCFIIRGNSGAWAELLWAHRWSLYSQTVNINGKRVMDYTFEPENQSNVQTLCHEMFHSVGSPDLYHYSQDDMAPVGGWDLMESGSGHMGAFMKWKYTNNTWISDIPEITAPGTYTLHPLTSPTNNAYRLASPNNPDEYFVFEYRKKEGVYETNIPGSGLIVYRINPNAGDGNASGPPDEVYIYRPNGTLSVDGNIGAAFFSSDIGRTQINDQTNPSCFLSDGTPGGIEIFDVTSVDTTISFTYGVNYKPTAAFEALPRQSCTGYIEFVDQSLKQPTSWLWDFGDGTTSTLQNPSHTFYTNGYKTIKLKVENSYGVDSVRMFNYVRIEKPTAPNATGDSSCTPASFQLTATSLTGGDLNWFDQPAGGTSLFTGTTFQTPILDTTTTYFVEETTNATQSNVGAPDSTIGNGSFFNNTNTHYLVFDTYQTTTLKSVKVYAQSTKDRTIAIKDLNDNIIFDTTVTLTTGEHRIELNFIIPAGTNYKIECTTPNCLLYRNSSGGQYPYTVANVLSIHDNSASSLTRYYYFYDWEVIGQSCISNRRPVTAAVLIAEAGFTHTSQNLTVNFQNTSAAASSSFWDFGDGTSSTSVNPQHTFPAAGTYNVTLTVVNICDTDSITQQVTVSLQGIENNAENRPYQIYPNPVNDFINLLLNKDSEYQLEIINTLGQVVYSEKIKGASGQTYRLNTSHFKQGVYFIFIKTDTVFKEKILKL